MDRSDLVGTDMVDPADLASAASLSAWGRSAFPAGSIRHLLVRMCRPAAGQRSDTGSAGKPAGNEDPGCRRETHQLVRTGRLFRWFMNDVAFLPSATPPYTVEIPGGAQIAGASAYRPRTPTQQT